MVLHVLFYIVQMNWSHLAHAHFLIHGHTKNTCDCLFNLLKMQWRKKNVYTSKQLQHLLEVAPNCECAHCNNVFFRIGLTEVSHIAHFWVSYGRCAMPGLPMGWSEGLSWWWAD